MIGVNVTEFKNLLALAGAFTEDATFRKKDNTLELVVIDPAHVAMAKGSIPLTEFPEDMDCFTINVERAQKALSTTGDDVTIDIKNGVMIIKNDKSRAKLSLIATDSKEVREPAFKVSAYAYIQPARVKTAMSYGALSKADYVKILLVKGHLTIETGEYPNSAEIEGDEDGEGDAMAGFMMDYVQTIVDLAIKAKSNLTIGLGGNDFPAKFIWKSGDNSTFSVLLAPRIES